MRMQNRGPRGGGGAGRRGGRHGHGPGQGRGMSGGRGRGGGSRGARILSRDELKLLLLSLILDEKRHGYELIRLIKSASKGAYGPSSGMVYPALMELAEEGLASHEEGEGGRKIYIASDAGREQVTAQKDELAAVLERLEALGAKEEVQHVSLNRALANLDMVLSQSTTDATDEHIDQIVDLIDDMSRKIERLGR